MPLPSPATRTLLALWGLPLALILALVVGPILRDGMFIDGLAYTNIARDMARGVGSFWAPTADGGGSVFYGHPPLLLYLESLFFRAFGDRLYTEDLYNLTVLAATIGLMFLVWREAVGRGRWQLFFFPLLLFSLNQQVQLRYPNAMLECGMTLILLVATFGYLRLRLRSPTFACLVIGFGAALAFLAKGPVGLFILVLPVGYEWFVGRRFSWVALFLPVATLLTATGLLFLLEPAARSFLRAYVDHQVVTALTGRAFENVAGSRFALLGSLVGANVLGIGLSVLLLFVRSDGIPITQRRIAWALLLTGAAAVLPFLVSLKQADYYQLPALPYLFLGGSALLTDRLERAVTYLQTHRIAGGIVQVVSLSALIGCGAIALGMQGTTDRRDVTAIQQAEAIARIMDSLHADRYRLSVIDDPRGASSPLSHTLTGTLNRRHRLYHDPTDTSSLVLYLATHGGALPPVTGQQVLYTGEGVSLRR